MAFKNARLIEKDIFSAIPSDEAGESEVIVLDSADKFSCQAVYVVDTPVDAGVTWQASNDNENWTNIEAQTVISGNGTVMLEQPNVSYRYFKAVKALGSGDVDLKAYILVIGDAV